MTVSDRVGRSVLSDTDAAVDDGRLASSMSTTSDQFVPSQPRVDFQRLFNFIGKLFSAFLPIPRPSSTSSNPSTSSSTTQSLSTASTLTTSSTTSTETATSTTLSTPSYYPQSDIFPQLITATLDYWITITSTNTFFVQQCTPSPFPFAECLNSRRYSKTPAH